MFLNKTTVGKTAPEPSAKNVPSKPPPQTAKPSASLSPVAPRSVSSLISAAGLPADKISASIVSFARFFSLPLKPELMAAIRRQVFAPSFKTTSAANTQPDTVKHTVESTPDSGAAAKNREALSLAAAAAESKGVELNPKGLQAFAEAVDPDWQKRQEGEGQHRGRRNRNHNEREDEDVPLKTGSITASGLEETALESAQKNPLLAILNRLPGKNGQRWIVLPFNFCENGREFRVSMRILLETGQAANRVICMALDIAESSGTEQRQLFVLEPANGQINRLAVYFQPELPPKAHSLFVRELSNLLEISPQRIFIKNWTEPFICESACEDDLLRSIDEAV